tara:strand:- start:5508 stop:6941 length:1434 start_codon:yes stop_codon:yes gene_type:complete
MEINTSLEENRFNDHLKLIDNNQIIFSGIFGIGKTYFLKKFFINNSKYETFRLSPVNYSISNTDDIIEYIKYDIIFELLSKPIDYEVEKFPKELTSQFYIKENFIEITSLIAKHFGKIGKKISDIVIDLNKLKKDIEKHNENYSIDEKDEIISFLKNITNTTGSIFEENRITLLISNLVESLKSESKETILIIDDLDRLDPEHIFRILNVFACHFDFENTSNKFGFDKIILVCDINNIRKIFSSKYGQETDFSGYIDKFFSNEIFFFNNAKEIENQIPQILSSINCVPECVDNFNLSDYRRNKLLVTIINDLITSNSLNLRTLLRLSKKQYHIKNYRFIIAESFTNIANNQNLEVILIFDFLSSIFGSKDSLNQAILNLSMTNKSKYAEKGDYYIYAPLMELIDYKNHKLKKGQFTYENSELDLIIHYTIDRQGYRIYSDISSITNRKNQEIKDYLPYSDLLKIAFNQYLNLEIKNN